MAKKYNTNKKAFGGTITPQEMLINNQRMWGEAAVEAEANPLVQGLTIANGVIGSAGNILLNQGLNKMAYGGQLVPAEVEGNEMGELPNGMLLDFKGPTHEQGGVDVDLPEGTKIYSDRVAIDGKTMAQRKKYRENKVKNLEKKVNKGDMISKATLERYMLTVDQEEELDMRIQELLNNKTHQFGGGGIVDTMGESVGKSVKNTYDEWTKKLLVEKFGQQNNQNNKSGFKDFLGNSLPYLGDAMGIVGNIQAGLSNQKAVNQAKAMRTPEVNHFKDFGKDALQTIDDSKKYARQMGEIARGDIELQRQAATGRNRESATGINTQRALDLAGQAQTNRLDLASYAQESAQLQQIMGEQSRMESMRDQMVMAGEGARDMRERDTNDNINNMQLRADQAKANALTNTGKAVGDMFERNATMGAMNSVFTNFKFTPGGKLRNVPGQTEVINNVAQVRANPTKFGLTAEQVKDMNDSDVIGHLFNNLLKGGLDV